MSGYKKSAHGFPDILRKFSLLPLTVPAVLFVLLFLVLPSALLFSYSIQTQSVAGDTGLPLTLSNYERLFDVPLYFRVLVTTLKISLITAFVTVVIGFPVALVIVRGSPLFGRILTIVIIAPLVLSSVVRTYGWMLVLANTDAGVVNWFLSSIGLGPAALRVLYTQTAVVISSVHAATLVKGGPNRDLGVAFIDRLFEHSVQSGFAEKTWTAPSVGGIEISAKLRPHLVYPEEQIIERNLVIADWEKLIPQRSAIVEKLNSVLLG